MNLKQVREKLNSFCKKSDSYGISFIDINMSITTACTVITEFPMLVFRKTDKDMFTIRYYHLSENELLEKKMLDKFLIACLHNEASSTILHLNDVEYFSQVYLQFNFIPQGDGTTIVALKKPFDEIKEKVHVISKSTTPP